MLEARVASRCVTVQRRLADRDQSALAVVEWKSAVRICAIFEHAPSCRSLKPPALAFGAGGPEVGSVPATYRRAGPSGVPLPLLIQAAVEPGRILLVFS
jgi:hypothetical protein